MIMRAGGLAGKYSAKRRLISGKFEISVTSMVVLATRSMRLPPAFKTVSRLRNACRASASKPAPEASPVAGSTPGWPETNNRLPWARTACEYGPIVFRCGTWIHRLLVMVLSPQFSANSSKATPRRCHAPLTRPRRRLRARAPLGRIPIQMF